MSRATQESSKQIAMLQELTEELSKSQLTAMSELEEALRGKLSAAAAEAQAAQQTAAEERQLRRQQIQKETKEHGEGVKSDGNDMKL